MKCFEKDIDIYVYVILCIVMNMYIIVKEIIYKESKFCSVSLNIFEYF